MSGGRPCKLTPSIQAAIVASIANGATRQAAADLAGIGAATVREWIARGEGRDPDRPATPELEDFAAEVRRAEASLEIRCVETILASDNWRAAAWLLERRFPDRWGPSARHEVRAEVVTRDEPAVPRFDLKLLSDDQLARIRAGEPLASVIAESMGATVG